MACLEITHELYTHYFSVTCDSYTSPQLYSTITVPSVPRLLSVTRILSDGLELNWLPPRQPNGRPQYEIQYRTDNSNFTTLANGRQGVTHYNLTGLQQNVIYYIRVVAVNYVNGTPLRGNESETITATVAPTASGENAHNILLRYIRRSSVSWTH